MTTANAPSAAIPTNPVELHKVLQQAQRGDEKALPVLREMMKQQHVVEACGNLATHFENTLIRRVAGKDLAISEGVRRKLEALRVELAGPTPAPLERLLVKRVLACWLHLYFLEQTYASRKA